MLVFYDPCWCLIYPGLRWIYASVVVHYVVDTSNNDVNDAKDVLA
jgi:hypothetical protein